MTASRKMYSLRLSLATAFIAIVLATALMLGATTYFSAKKYARNDIRERLHNAAALAALLVRAEDHAVVQTTAQESSAEYLRIKKMLQEVRDRCAGVRYVWRRR